MFAQTVAFVLDVHVAPIAGIQDNLHEAQEVGFGLVAVFVEDMRLSAYALGIRHEFLGSLVPVVPDVRLAADKEVAEVRKGSYPRVIHQFHDPCEPLAIAGRPAMVLHDDVDALLIAVFTEAAQSVCGEALLFIERQALVAGGVHPDGMAAQEPGDVSPGVMILHCLDARRFIRVAEIPKRVAHDQEAAHPFAVRAPLQFLPVGHVPRFVEIKGIDILYGGEWKTHRR